MQQRVHASVVGAIALAAVAVAGPACAQERTNYGDMYNNIISNLGFGPSQAPIDYAPRPPIVVPPNNALPPPGGVQAERPAGFPVDPDVNARRQALVDPRRPAAGENGRSYLTDPPAVYLNPGNAPVAEGGAASAAKPASKKKAHRAGKAAAAAAD